MPGFDIKSAIPIAEQNGTPTKKPEFDINTAMQMTEPVNGENGFVSFQRAQFHQSIKDSIDRPISGHEANFIVSNEEKAPNAFDSFAVPYTEGVVGFFTKPFGVRPDLSKPFGLKKGPKSEEELKQDEAMKKAHPVTFTLGQVVAGTAPFIATAPLFPASLLGTAATFGTVGLTSKIGQQQTEESLLTPAGERAKELGVEALKAGVLAPVWHYSAELKFIGRPFMSAVARAGVRGTATAGLETAFGTDLGESLKQGGIITALSLMFEAPGLAKTALGRGIIGRANQIATEKGAGEGKISIDVDKLDEASLRSSLLGRVREFYRIMSPKLNNQPAPADPAKQAAYDRLTYTPESRADLAPGNAGEAIWAPKGVSAMPKAGGLAHAPEIAPIFYSKMASTLAEKMPESAPVDQIKGILASSGTPKEEIEWAGIEDFLKGKDKVSKTELLEYLQNNQMTLEETWKGFESSDAGRIEPLQNGKFLVEYPGLQRQSFDTIEEAQGYLKETQKNLGKDKTKFSPHTLPGGKNYKEMLISTPEVTKEGYSITPSGIYKGKEYIGPTPAQFKSSHWDEPNVLAHARLTDRETSDGKKVLFVEEIQSDWAREARSDKSVLPKIPSHPLLKHWQPLILKRLLRYAAENGYNYISWTTGEQQAQKYDLSRQVDKIRWDRLYSAGGGGDLYDIQFEKDGEWTSVGDPVIPGKLPEVIGKELAEKIIKNGAKKGTLSKIDIKVGGEWTKNLYDRQIPNWLNDYSKKFGAKVETLTLSTGEKSAKRGWNIDPNEDGTWTVYDATGTPVANLSTEAEAEEYKNNIKKIDTIQHSLAITPEIKQALLQEGQPYFGKMPQDMGAAGKEFSGIKIFRMDEEVKLVNTKGEIVTLPKGEEYRTLPVYDADNNIVPNKVRLLDGKQITVYEGELRKLKGKMLGEGDMPKAGGLMHGIDSSVKKSYTVSEGESKYYEVPEEQRKSLSQSEIGISQSPLKVKYKKQGYFVFPQEKITSPADVAFAFQQLKNEAVERFYVVGIKNNIPISVEPISIGTLSASLVTTFDPLHLLLVNKADSYYLVHNHPSGNITPSKEDISVTEKSLEAYKKLNLTFKGHVIIDDTKFGLINQDLIASSEDQAPGTGKGKKVTQYSKYIEWLEPIPETAFAGPEDVFSLIKGLNTDWKKNALVLYLSSRNSILGSEFLPHEKTNASTIAKSAVSVRASNILIANSDIPDEKIIMLSRGLSLYNINLLDMVNFKNKTKFESKREGGFISDKKSRYSAGKKPPKEPPETAVSGSPEEEPTDIQQRKENMELWNTPDITDKLLIDEKQFLKKYLDEGKTLEEIAAETGEDLEDVKKLERWTYSNIEKIAKELQEGMEKAGEEEEQSTKKQIKEYLTGKLNSSLKEEGEYAELKHLPWLFSDKGQRPDVLASELGDLIGFPMGTEQDVIELIKNYFRQEITGRAATQESKETKAAKEKIRRELLKSGKAQKISPEHQKLVEKLRELLKEKQLSNITASRIRKFLGIKELKNTSIPEMQRLINYIKEEIEPGDKLLSDKQIASIKKLFGDVEGLTGMPKRIAIDRFGDMDGLMDGLVVGKIANELLPSVDIKEGHPLIAKIIDGANTKIEEAESNIHKRDDEFERLITKAEKSREKFLTPSERLKRSLTKQNKEIFEALSGEIDQIDLTPSEQAVMIYLRDFFAEVRDKLSLSKYRKNYITHLEQPLMEKIFERGLIGALKQFFSEQSTKKDNIPVDIMLELDNIIGSKKFFRFALERKGGLTPTTNIRKIVHDYSSIFETKLALDQILPEGQTVTKLLLQGKSAVWMKKFLQNLKGRGLDNEFRTGKMGWLIKMADGIVDISYMKLLATNWRSAVKNIVAGEANAMIWEDFSSYLEGKKRFISNPKKAYNLAIEYGILEGTYADYSQRGIGKLKKWQDMAMIGQQAGEIEIRTSMLVSELTSEEWKTGIISPERTWQIKDSIAITQGIFSKVESPLWVQTTLGRVIMQMNRWRITDAMLLRRIVNGVREEWSRGERKGQNSRRLAKALLFYIIGMYAGYELTKAGFKKAGQIAQAMSETVNSLISLISQGDLSKMLTDNPTLSAIKGILFTAQDIANYIHVPGAQKTKEISFNQGIEDTYIAPLETAKDLINSLE